VERKKHSGLLRGLDLLGEECLERLARHEGCLARIGKFRCGSGGGKRRGWIWTPHFWQKKPKWKNAANWRKGISILFSCRGGMEEDAYFYKKTPRAAK
jgi:hypothetical protein